jgi:hypothetical protein
MSGIFVSKNEIDALVTAAITWGIGSTGEFWFRPVGTRQVRKVTWANATEVGEMLWRYNYDITEGWVDPPEVEWPGYVFERYPGEPDPLVVLKAICHYEVETGGGPEHDVTPAAGFMNSLETVAIGKLPGWADAPYGIWDRGAFGG